jgi:small-conductance mechanosensitive channel
MYSTLSELPQWGSRLLWTGLTVGIAYGLGHLINIIVISRLGRLAKQTSGTWDDVVVAELKRRIPFWSLLVGAWMALGHWELHPETVRVATAVFSALGVASVTFALAGMATRLIASYGTRQDAAVPVSALTQNVARIVIITLGVLVIVKGLGYDITPYLTALGVGGLAVALALQEPLGNLFAGIFLTIAGQIRIGDYVKLDTGLEGYVEDFDWRSTRIRMLANNRIIVPNSKLSQAIVTNYSLPDLGLAVLLDVGVEYSSDLKHVERVTIEVAKEVMHEVTGGVPDFQPFTRYHTFGDSSINFTVIMRAKTYVDQFLVKHEFVKRLHARYEQEGISIPFPIRTLSARDPISVVVRREEPAATPTLPSRT